MILGTTVKLTAVTDSTPTSITISIYDPNDVIKVTDQVMTDDGSNSYSYLYQNTTSDTAGTYTAVVSAVTSTYTSKSKRTFILEEIL